MLNTVQNADMLQTKNQLQNSVQAAGLKTCLGPLSAISAEKR